MINWGELSKASSRNKAGHLWNRDLMTDLQVSSANSFKTTLR